MLFRFATPINATRIKPQRFAECEKMPHYHEKRRNGKIDSVECTASHASARVNSCWFSLAKERAVSAFPAMQNISTAPSKSLRDLQGNKGSARQEYLSLRASHTICLVEQITTSTAQPRIRVQGPDLLLISINGLERVTCIAPSHARKRTGNTPPEALLRPSYEPAEQAISLPPTAPVAVPAHHSTTKIGAQCELQPETRCAGACVVE